MKMSERAGGKSVQDGKLIKVSASLVSAFDYSSPFGCERRGWFRYVAGKEEPTTGATALGIALHKANEVFLTEGNEPEDFTEAKPLFEAGKKEVARLKPLVQGIELKVTGEVAGVPLTGYCDLVTNEPGIVDWKTTSSISRYGKSEEDLKTDVQMICYAKFLHPTAETVHLMHGQYQTKGAAKFKKVSAVVTKKDIDKVFVESIIPRVERIKEVVAVDEVRKLKRAEESKCRRCPHVTYCPNNASEAIMSMFNKYAKEKETILTPEITAPDRPKAVEKAPAPAPQILPPDAPASKPELAADPLPVEKPEVFKKRGRPTGGAKAAKAEEPAAVVVTPPEVKSTEPVVGESVTVSYGLTMNLGAFNSARFDVSLTVRSKDLEAAYAKALADVKAKVLEETSKIHAAMKQPDEKK